MPKVLTKEKRGVISQWQPEDPEFWQSQGKTIARKNLFASVFCLMLAFCVWMIFSVVAVNLNKAGFNFSDSQLFLLTALPAISGAILRVPYSFVISLFGGRRWTALSTGVLLIPCIWLGFAIRDPQTPFTVFVIISLMCGFAGANFASSMGNISFFFPKKQQGGALGINGGLGNMGVSVMQLLVPLVISCSIFTLSAEPAPAPGESPTIWLENAAWVWVPLLILATLLAWYRMNDLSVAKSSLRQQLPILKRPHLWIMSLLYLATFGSFIGFSAGFAMLSKTQFPDVVILKYAFFGPLLGAIARSIGGILSDKLGGVKVTLVNFIAMAVFAGLIFLTLPGTDREGSFFAFYTVFMLLFLTAGLGSGSTFQMIAVIFSKQCLAQALREGNSQQDAQQIASTDTAAALGFISAIGAAGGFFIPQTFGISLDLTHSPVGAMAIFLVFYLICVATTWLVYGRHQD